MKNQELGYSKDETCNRDNCKGAIHEHDTDGGCSCHINPPCSYCTENRSYCPECGWDGKEEDDLAYQEETKNYYKGFGSKEMHDDYHKQKLIQDEFDRKFSLMYRGKEPADRLITIHLSHTHFSMIKKGVFPKGTETRESLVPKIQGTFGGRFNSFTDHSFEYIAYTD